MWTLQSCSTGASLDLPKLMQAMKRTLPWNCIKSLLPLFLPSCLNTQQLLKDSSMRLLELGLSDDLSLPALLQYYPPSWETSSGPALWIRPTSTATKIKYRQIPNSAVFLWHSQQWRGCIKSVVDNLKSIRWKFSRI